MIVLFNCTSSCFVYVFFFFKQKTAYEMRISDWSSDVCSSDLDNFRSDGAGGGSFFAPFLRSEGTRHRWIGLASCPERIAQQIGMVVTSSLTIAVQQGDRKSVV